MTRLRISLVLALAALSGGCASTRQAEQAAAVENIGPTTCDSFFVYTMCMTDRASDGDVDFVYFADDLQIFMYRPGETLPTDMPVHRCARPIYDPLQGYGNALMYEELSLLEEMDVKRKMLLEFMAAKEEVDDCYGGDSATGQAEGAADEEFVSEDFDWGED